jgi:hypothetical protein
MSDSVRFSVVVQTGGQPQLYLPLANPRQDREFMRAVRDERVLSLKQEPTGSKKDFGIVGLVEEKFVSYLVFPKTLRKFAGKRVIGIKYDTLKQSKLTTARGASPGKKPPRNPLARAAINSRRAPAKPKPKPAPPRFTATVRFTAMQDVEVTVEARNQQEARAKAAEAARPRIDWVSANVETKVTGLHRNSGA